MTDNIFSKIGVNLHQRESHPLGILKEKINEYFRDVVKEEFENVDDLEPVVSTEMNFDQVSGCVAGVVCLYAMERGRRHLAFFLVHSPLSLCVYICARTYISPGVKT